MNAEPLIETWEIHDRINRYLLDAVSAEALLCSPPWKGRAVGEQFAHIHNVRLLWLKQAAPESTDALTKIEKSVAADKMLLDSSLDASGRAIRELLARSFRDGGRVKGFRPPATAFLGYLVAHEAHHRGEIVMTLKGAGMPVDRRTLFGMWEWGVR